MELRFDEVRSEEYQSQAEVMAEPNANWTHQPLSNMANNNNNNSTAGGKVRQKRDFRFQVIQIRQGPKWFIFPSAKDEEKESKKKKNGSNQENESKSSSSMEDAPKSEAKGVKKPETVMNSANTSNANQQEAVNIQNNNTHLRRSQRFSNRRRFQVQPVAEPVAIEDEMTRVTATKQLSSNAPLSEPTTRRLNCRPQPSSKTQESLQNSSSNATIASKKSTDSCCSTSAPSTTFKILSISKKWESDEDEDEDLLECTCRKMSLSFDDDCHHGQAHIVAASGVHLVITPPPESNGNRFKM